MPFFTQQSSAPYYHWPMLPVIQHQQNESRLVQNQLQNQLERHEEQIAQLEANI
jgi:hypothetical protein